MDKYKQYYDRDYIAKHRPILLLKFDGQSPDEWHLSNAGGQFALPSWADVAASAVNSRDNFRKYVTDPPSMNPQAGMPAYPTFNDDTFNALEAYIKAMMPIE